MKIALTPYGQALSSWLLKIKTQGTTAATPYISRYQEQLFNYTRLDPYQLACLATFAERWETDNVWREDILKKVAENFAEWYDEPTAPHPISLQCITLPDRESQTWELGFEDSTADPVVHVALEGFKWELLGLTH